MKYKLFTPNEIKRIDKDVLKSMDQETLIDDVGRALAKWFLKNTLKSDSIAVLCGPGNNGKDGHSLNKFLNEYGFNSKAFDLDEVEEKEVSQSIVVDSVFGISLNKPLSKNLQNFISNNQHKKIISIDVPSGVSAKTGEVLGGAFKAQTTLTVGALKVGLFVFPGRECSGEVVCVPVKALEPYVNKIESEYVSIDLKDTSLYPKRSPMDHKYSKGVCGFVMSKTYPGAAILAAKASMASGAGYVKIYAPKVLLRESQLAQPDFVFDSYEDEKDLSNKLLIDEKIDSLCIGVGWDFKVDNLLMLFQKFEKNLVVDGGAMKKEALNLLKEKENVVFTPHKGEQDRAFQDKSKILIMEDFCKEFSGVLVSKGYDTLIGQKGHKKALTLQNSPKLSVAGTGDVLAGLITGLMALSLSAYEAALMAQRLQFLGAESSFERMSALDLIESIKRLKLYDND